MIDQTQLAEDLSSKIKYEFRQMFLVKPLEPVKVKKKISEYFYKFVELSFFIKLRC